MAFLIGAGTLLSGPAWAQDYILGPRDVLNITVYDHKDLQTKVRVSEDGKITFPLLGELSVSGLSVQQLERKVTKLLANGYIVDPHVGVFVEEFRVVVYVTGEVNKPGSYPYEEGMTAIKAISLAGGLTARAAEGKITVTRKGKSQPETTLLVGMHDLIRPDDVLQIPEKRWVYVTGEVNRPASYPYEEGMTAIKAISLAGGLTTKAAEGKITVTRKGENQAETTLLVGMHDLIRPDDVLQIPEKRWVYVTGEVKKPGSYMYDDQMTILKAIALAGGLTDKAAPKRTEIIRKTDGKEATIRVKMEDSILPEDVIVVPESFF
jgi:protein involved in polysaccharide export with SLBB domain